jgi:hypothetical protein
VRVTAGDAEHERDLAEVEAVPELRDDIALTGAQPAARGTQQRPRLGLLGPRADVGGGVSGLRRLADRGGHAGRPQPVQALVAGYGEEPSPQPLRVPQSREVRGRDDELLPHRVGGVGGLAKH